MTFVVNESCIRCKIMDCVDVCPVDCFYEGENMLVIHPDECIDCGVCVPECPVDAIKPDTEPGLEKWLSLNAEYAKIWPNIMVKKAPPPDSKKWEGNRLAKGDRLTVWQLDLLAIVLLAHEYQSLFALMRSALEYDNLAGLLHCVRVACAIFSHRFLKIHSFSAGGLCEFNNRRDHADSRNGTTSIAPLFPFKNAAVLIATASAALNSTASAECTYRDVIVRPLCPTSAPMVNSE